MGSKGEESEINEREGKNLQGIEFKVIFVQMSDRKSNIASTKVFNTI